MRICASVCLAGAGELAGGPQEEAVAKLLGEESTGLPHQGASRYMRPGNPWKPLDVLQKGAHLRTTRTLLAF